MSLPLTERPSISLPLYTRAADGGPSSGPSADPHLELTRRPNSRISRSRPATSDGHPHWQTHGIGGILVEEVLVQRQALWDRFRGKGRRRISWLASAKNVVKSSWLNVLFICIPLGWIAHFLRWAPPLVFTLCLLSIIPLENLFDYCGEQMALYCGKDLGDLIVVTLDNTVEATLAVVLLLKCELKILQSTITGTHSPFPSSTHAAHTGVVLLHLLLVPGTAFLTGGARIWEQNLHPHPTQLNHTLLTIGVLTLLIPAAFFGALDRGPAALALANDDVRAELLHMSRGLAGVLLSVYVASRIFLHNPPGPVSTLRPASGTPAAAHYKEEAYLAHVDPTLNPWFCVALLVLTVGIMAATTAEWLVDSIASGRMQGNIQQEWLGLILLPLASFSADGAVAILYFARAALFLAPTPPAAIAKAREIDLSIQFTLFWMPLLVLLGWCTGRPLMLLFDYYEVAVLLGACFLVNYVTADAKTNWAEGFVLVSFYLMIALCTWFYTGQPEIQELLQCGGLTAAVGGE